VLASIVEAQKQFEGADDRASARRLPRHPQVLFHRQVGEHPPSPGYVVHNLLHDAVAGHSLAFLSKTRTRP
jgi:hypothetical protein